MLFDLSPLNKPVGRQLFKQKRLGRNDSTKAFKRAFAANEHLKSSQNSVWQDECRAYSVLIDTSRVIFADRFRGTRNISCPNGFKNFGEFKSSRPLMMGGFSLVLQNRSFTQLLFAR
ncbi:MAG: hypothetical protein ABIE74_02440 [Pseudomonadota bacterium]